MVQVEWLKEYKYNNHSYNNNFFIMLSFVEFLQYVKFSAKSLACKILIPNSNLVGYMLLLWLLKQPYK